MGGGPRAEEQHLNMPTGTSLANLWLDQAIRNGFEA